jgi:L-ascorbate peroxidase
MLRRASATAIAAIIGDAEQDARRAIAELVRHRRCGPALLRLAFHDAATFDAETRTGGANASIR